ncbi:MAG TPA: HWE histidine kinase domain-containing protein, partial [Tabrizicola sp.]|nr:HWE histidine kinase domain-containing protein [Tabrizicola sp.]
FLALVHPEDRERCAREAERFDRTDLTEYSQTFRILRPDGSVRVILDRGSVDRNAGGQVVVTRGFNVDVTDEAHLNYSAERQLRVSEERYRKLFDAIDQGFCIVEVRLDAPGGRVDYRVVEANPAFYEKTGFPKAILGAWLREAAPDLEEHWFETYGEVARTGQSIRFENHSPFLGRWFEVFAFRLDEDSRKVAILFNDVSERRQQQEQMQLLVDEINHRSKNMLGVIQVIARNTAASDATEFIARFGERVRGLAASNELLVRNGWSTVELEDLVRSQLEPFSDFSSGRVLLDGARIALSPVATRALGMALHELATNAVKYGALSNATGRIRVTWAWDKSAGGRFRLSWTEEGGPTVYPPTRRGFGSKVTTMMVESTTSGRVVTSFPPEGFVWQLDCPAAGLMA